jgi:hypothetical protein
MDNIINTRIVKVKRIIKIDQLGLFYQQIHTAAECKNKKAEKQ